MLQSMQLGKSVFSLDLCGTTANKNHVLQIPVSQDSFIIRGGRPLSGRVTPQGNKNEALPILSACLLTDEPVVVENLPAIEDVRAMVEILSEIGVSVEHSNGTVSKTLRVQAREEPRQEIPGFLASAIRGSITLAGPLLARCGRARLPKPGGDRIGRRRLDTHIQALHELGAVVDVGRDSIELRCAELKGADIWLEEASVTATENAICAAVLAKGTTTLRNAACEPHVQNLCRMLSSMGARITGVGSNLITIEGVERLRGTRHRISPDYLEVGSFISLAAVTRSDLVIEDVPFEDMRMILRTYSRLGIETLIEGNSLRVPARQTMEIVNDLGGATPVIDDGPWPAFPADMTSVALVTATQCRGTVIIHEKMFESRLFFTDRLISMGARIVLCDPHRAVVIGPERLYGATMSSPDIRAGMALIIAALCAEGESRIQNINQIDRGFAMIDERLRALGAEIIRTEK